MMRIDLNCDMGKLPLHLSEGTGDLVGLHWKDPNLEVVGEPSLGENFRLLMPNIGYEANYFNSRDQHVSRFETIPDGVICVCDSLQNDFGGSFMFVPRNKNRMQHRA